MRLNIISNLGLSKRQKIVVASIFITVGFLISTQTYNVVFGRYYFIYGMGALAFLVSLWALWENINKTKIATLIILPVLFSLGVTSMYFTFREVQWFTRLPSAFIVGFLFYLLLLAENVFNVAAATRTIPLYRAASTASFVFTVLTSFFLFSVVSTLNDNFVLNGVVVMIISFLLILQSIWALDMEKITTSVLVYSLVLSLIIGECGLALSFWPVAPTIWALLLSTSLYICLGVLSDSLRDKMTGRVVAEYLGAGVAVLVFAALFTSWVG
jgi:hypothetical protein